MCILFAQDFWAHAGFHDASSDSEFNVQEDPDIALHQLLHFADTRLEESDDTQETDFSQAQDEGSAEEKAALKPSQAG